MSRRAAVLGSPIAHSLSPLLHRAAYAELGLDWSYDAIEVSAAQLAGFLGRVRAEAPRWAGLSLTMPLKAAAVDLVDRCGSDLGALNTVVVDPAGTLSGYNTDVDGVLRAWRLLGCEGARAVVLGAGGTARAVLAALVRAGVGQVSVVSRDETRAASVLALGRRLGLELRWIALAELHRRVAGVAGEPVVSTLPAGVSDELAVSGPLLDVVYHPWPTRYAERVASAGWAVVGGHEVLLGQAVKQVELMTGRPAPVGVMGEALRTALRALPPPRR